MLQRKRIAKEFGELQKEPPEGIRVTQASKDVRKWMCFISGPDDTPYKGGEFELSVDLTGGYPLRAPVVKLNTRIFHMNINRAGTICLAIIDEWSNGGNSVSDVFDEITDLLKKPNTDSALQPELAVLYTINEKKYNETAKEWTAQHAMKHGAPKNKNEKAINNKNNPNFNIDNNNNYNNDSNGNNGNNPNNDETESKDPGQ